MSEYPKDHWFRSADWDAASKAEFVDKLARARPYNRIQYRRVKALALLDTGDVVRETAGREMLEENLATPDLPSYERTLALATLARNDRSRGRVRSAMQLFRDVIHVIGTGAGGNNGEEEIELAELLLERGGDTDVREAKSLLDHRSSDEPLFLRSRYRLAVAHAHACLKLADPSSAAAWATTALELAAADDSGLRYHPELGLVDAPDAQLAWLQDVAKGHAAPS